MPSPIGGIGRITTAGVQLSAFPSPKAAVEMPSGDHRQGSLTRGPDGNLWFTDAFTSSIGRITLAGVVTEFGGIDQPTDITLGADGNLWFTNSRNSSLGRLTGSGVLGNFPVSDNTAILRRPSLRRVPCPAFNLVIAARSA